VYTASSINLFGMAGAHSLAVTATDLYGNSTTVSVSFSVTATVDSLTATVNRLFDEGKITNAGVRDGLLSKLATAQAYLDAGKVKGATSALNAFVNQVRAQTGKAISTDAATRLTADAQYVVAHPG
jgi:hypothetical protein